MRSFLIRLLLPAGMLLLLEQTAATQPAVPDGAQVYKQRCSYCHGAEGKGDGPPNSVLNVKARDLTSGTFKFRSTESGSLPTDDDLRKTIADGLHGTSMPAWKGLLSDAEVTAVLGHVKSLSPRFQSEKPKPVAIPRPVLYPESGAKRGKVVYEKLQCASCHGTDGKGTGAIVTEFEDEWGSAIVASDLTQPWTFKGGSTEKDIYLRLRTGLDGTPMPSYKGSAPDVDLWSVAQYVRSLARKPMRDMTEAELRAHLSALDAKAKADPVARGKYLVSFMGCTDCHTPLRPDGSMMNELYLAGGQRWTLEPFFTNIYTRNLTSDSATGLGAFTDDQLRDVFRKGIRPRDGSRMLPFPMPWPNYAGLSDDDLDAIIAYLRSLPPVRNNVPERDEPNIFSYLWMKFEMLILKKPFPSFIVPGNAASAGEQSLSSVTAHSTEVKP